jgi:hypothetical protein
MTLSLTLPDSAGLGDAGHITDHNLIVAALADIEDAINASGSGLSLITTASLAAATTVSINNCFTTDYDNYLIVFDVAASASSYIGVRLRASASDNTTSNYYSAFSGGTYANVGYSYFANGDTAFFPAATGTGSYHTAMAMNVNGPQAAKKTYVHGTFANGHGYAPFGGRFDATTQFDGFTLYTVTGGVTLTGTVRVYGYKNT